MNVKPIILFTLPVLLAVGRYANAEQPGPTTTPLAPVSQQFEMSVQQKAADSSQEKTGTESRAVDEKVHEYKLNNGMNIIVTENHRAPVVVSQVWYKVGSSYEHDGITGVSHVLEHMMFKGTEKHPAGEFSKIIAANGGEENAFTGQDYTAYFQRIANDRLELCLELVADRMRNLTLDNDEFTKEVEVVKEERRLRTEDKPTALTYERFNSVAFTNNPYRHPTIGWMEDLDSMTIDDVRKWYQKWYAPNNATLVVAGDVKPDDVYKLAKKYFGPLKPSSINATKPRKGVEQYGPRRMTVELPAKLPYIVMGYKAPVQGTVENEWEVYALEVLAGVLDGGSSARFSNSLVRGQQIASSASAGYSMTSKHDTLFVITAVPNDDISIDVLESALRDQVNKLKQAPPDADELDRVKAQVLASEVYKKDSVFYQAMEIGMLETIGLPWQDKDEYARKILAVTADQVQQVAKKYLVDKHMTVAVLEPLPIEQSETIEQNEPVAGEANVE